MGAKAYYEGTDTVVKVVSLKLYPIETSKQSPIPQ